MSFIFYLFFLANSNNTSLVANRKSSTQTAKNCFFGPRQKNRTLLGLSNSLWHGLSSEPNPTESELALPNYLLEGETENSFVPLTKTLKTGFLPLPEAATKCSDQKKNLQQKQACPFPLLSNFVSFVLNLF